jgi:hypothetical protein
MNGKIGPLYAFTLKQLKIIVNLQRTEHNHEHVRYLREHKNERAHEHNDF